MITPEKMLNQTKEKENNRTNNQKLKETLATKRVSVLVNLKFTGKSVVKIEPSTGANQITKPDFERFIRLLELVNIGKMPSTCEIDLPNLLIEIFVRILIKKKFIMKDLKRLKWTSENVKFLLSTTIIKKKEESLKFVIRETFAILNDKYRTMHYIYWNSVNPKSSLKVERDFNFYVGFTRFYFGEIIDRNKSSGTPDQISNYTLPNKKNGNLKSNNKSITPKFLKRIFQSRIFYEDFRKVLESPEKGIIKKSLRNVLYRDSEKKIKSWMNLFEENKSIASFKHALKKKVSGSKAKLPWFRVEIESAISIVQMHINNIMQTQFKSLYS